MSREHCESRHGGSFLQDFPRKLEHLGSVSAGPVGIDPLPAQSHRGASLDPALFLHGRFGCYNQSDSAEQTAGGAMDPTCPGRWFRDFGTQAPHYTDCLATPSGVQICTRKKCDRVSVMVRPDRRIDSDLSQVSGTVAAPNVIMPTTATATKDKALSIPMRSGTEASRSLRSETWLAEGDTKQSQPLNQSARMVPVAFAVGLPRSGTTLLGSLLAGADGSLSISEPYLAQSLYSDSRLRRFFSRVQRGGGLARLTPPKGANLEEMLGYMCELTSQSGLSRLIVKETYRSSREWRNLELMNWIAESSRPTIALMRHPYDVAISSIRFTRWWRGMIGHALRLFAPRLPLFSNDREVVEHVADNWMSFFRWCRTHGIRVVRYEDLVTHPDEQMRIVCETLKIPFELRMLDPGHPRSAFGGIGDPMVMKKKDRPVRRSSVGRKRELAPELQRLIADRCSSATADCGYKL